MDELVQCDRHGRDRPVAFVCRHLADGSALELRTDEPVTAENPWPDAYCERCAEVRGEMAEEWSDAALEFADVTVVCDRCYEERRDARLR